MADPAGAIDRLAAGGRVSIFPLSGKVGTPLTVASTRSGQVWTSEFTGNFEHTPALIRIGGPVVRVPFAHPASDIDALATGVGNSVWATDYGTDQIDELTATTIRHFSDRAPYSGLNDLTLGPDGAIWFTTQSGLIGRVTQSGAVSELALAGGSHPDGIVAGPAQTIWVAEAGANTIARLSLH